DNCQPRDLFDQPQLLELRERLAEGGAVAEVATGDDDPVGTLPIARFENAEHDALLPLEPERVDAVHQVDADFRAVHCDLANAAEARVEIAPDLERQRAVVERLR